MQPLGYLAWAACGKDPAFGPAAVLEQAARSNRWTAGELAEAKRQGRLRFHAGSIRGALPTVRQ